MRELTFHVPDMHCEACERSITNSVNKLPGIEQVGVDLGTKHVTVIWNPSQTDELAIKDRIERVGFTVG